MGTPATDAAGVESQKVEVSRHDPSLRETLDVGFLRWLCLHRWVVIGCVLLLYAGAFNGQWRISSDSSAYVSWAHRIADHAPAVLSQLPSHFYVGLPWLIAATFRLFSPTSLFAAQCLMLGLGLIGLALTYGLMRRRSGAGGALVVVFLLGVNHTYLTQSFRLLADLPLAIGAFLLLLGWERASSRKNAEKGLEGDLASPDPSLSSGLSSRGQATGGWLCIAAGAILMLTMKRAAWVLLLIVFGFQLFQVFFRVLRGERWGRFAAAGVLLGLGAVLFVVLDPRQPGASMAGMYLEDMMPWGRTGLPGIVHKVLYVSLPKFFSEVAAETSFGMELGPGLDETLGLLPLLAVLGLVRRAPLWVVLALLYTAACAIKGATPRYFVPILPIVALSWWRLAATLARWKPATVGPYLFWVCLGIWVIPNMIKNADLLIEQHRTPFLTHYKQGRYAGLKRMGPWTREHLDPEATLLGAYPKVLAHFTARRVLGPPELLDSARGSDGFAAVLRFALLNGRRALETDDPTRPEERMEGFGDFDGDGDADLLWRNRRTGRTGIRWMEGGDPLRRTELGPSPPDSGWRVGAIADLTQDGIADVIWHHSQTGENKIWRIRPDGGWDPAYLRDEPATDWAMRGAGDFNGDGMSDLLWRNMRTGGVVIWLMDRRRKIGGLGVARVADLNWRIAGVLTPPSGDANAILWRHRETGELVLWLMRGRVRVASQHLPSPPERWRLTGIADLDGNAMADLAWRDPRTGRCILWRRHSELYVLRPRGGVSEEQARRRGAPSRSIGRGGDESPLTLRRVRWPLNTDERHPAR